MNQVKIFDTTLRDGEQSPGCSMNLREKIEIAKCLERMKVDIIEAGFAISSPGDFESVQSIAREIKGCTIASLARSTEGDIDAAWNAVKEAADPRIHLFIATSPRVMLNKAMMLLPVKSWVLSIAILLIITVQSYISSFARRKTN